MPSLSQARSVIVLLAPRAREARFTLCPGLKSDRQKREGSAQRASTRERPCPGTLPGWAARTAGELNLLRRALSRIDVISRTGFLPVGYALLDSVVVVIVGLLLICRFKGIYDEVLLVSFATLIYVYVVRLIRDLDDPFEYEDGVARGASEIELFPIIEFREQLERRL